MRRCLLLGIVVIVFVLTCTSLINAEESIPSAARWIKGDRVNLRSFPDLTSGIKGLLDKGEEVVLLEATESWTRVQSSRLGEGWVYNSYLGVTRPDPVSRGSYGRVKELLAYAKQWLGVPYRYGGSTPQAFDCSGFTAYVYQYFGYRLPHSSVGQAQLGVGVSKDQLAPGDLLFFNTVGTRISHVGIYLGEGIFIHASSGKGQVTTSCLNRAYYEKRYVCARRFLQTGDASVERGATIELNTGRED